MKSLVISKSITERAYKSLDTYFNEIAKIGMISPQEEAILARKIQSGDTKALEQLTKANLRFVISVAKQYQHQGLTLGDLNNEGNMGLLTAAKRYDESKGFRFISYAVWWIRQNIICAIAVHARTIRLPYNKLTLLSKLYKASGHLDQVMGRKPTVDELAAYLEVSVQTVANLLSEEGACISIYEPLNREEQFTPIDFLRTDTPDPDDKVMYESIKTEIQYAMQVLDKRGREILIMFFGLGQFPRLSLEEIGQKLDITKEHAGRLKTRALSQLRNCSHAGDLRSYLS